MDASLFWSTLLLLLVVLDPVGNVPIFASVLTRIDSSRRTSFIWRESFVALMVLTLFFFFGGLLLSWFQLSSSALGVAGGTVLFLIAIRMVFPSSGEGPYGGLSAGIPFVVPIAIPAIAGPSALATVMVLAAQHPMQRATLWLALLVAMATTVITLFASTNISRWLGTSGMAAVERLMGLLLSALAVQMILTHLKAFWLT